MTLAACRHDISMGVAVAAAAAVTRLRPSAVNPTPLLSLY
jgi:hypothetical protein